MENEETYLPVKIEDIPSYESHYDDNKFWDKVRNIAKKVGETVLRPVLTLYYILEDGKISMKNKALIIGALGYFILPIDIIPDFIAVLGYTDDLAVIFILLKQLQECNTPEIQEKVETKISELLFR